MTKIDEYVNWRFFYVNGLIIFENRTILVAVSSYKCLLIDDDPLILDLLQHYCEKSELVSYSIACDHATNGLRLLSSESFDLVFLDYNMPDMNGKAFLDLKQDDSKVIMVTSETDFAVESYSYDDVVDYLLKPVSFEKFEQALKKNSSTTPQTKSTKELIYVKDGRKWIPLKFDEILYIKSDSNYLQIKAVNQSVMTLMKLTEMEEVLPSSFYRIHRSYIINSKFIDFISTHELSVSGHLIPISNSYKAVIDEIVKTT